MHSHPHRLLAAALISAAFLVVFAAPTGLQAAPPAAAPAETLEEGTVDVPVDDMSGDTMGEDYIDCSDEENCADLMTDSLEDGSYPDETADPEFSGGEN